MKIGVCTGGGDCPGLNAAIRAVVKHAVGTYGAEVIGIEDSFNGLMERPLRVRPLGLENVTDILTRGGTILGTTNRGDPFEFPVAGGQTPKDLSKALVDAYRELKLDGLIVIGGDGTQTIAARLHKLGLGVVGVPKTIDNDLAGTDQTIGFDTAVQIATEAVTRLQSTAESHDRIMVLEVMGRDAGFIALYAGIAGGANVVLLPEIPFDYAPILKKVEDRKSLGRYFTLVVVAEGAFEAGSVPAYVAAAKLGGMKRLGGIGMIVSEELEKRTGLEARHTVLGHTQRGGSPSAYDRILASAFGARAVDLVVQKRFGRIVVKQGAGLSDVAYEDVAGRSQPIVLDKDPLIATAEAIGICLGRESAFKTLTAGKARL